MDIQTMAPSAAPGRPPMVPVVSKMPSPGGFMAPHELWEPGGIADGIRAGSVPIITRGMDMDEMAKRSDIVERMVSGINESIERNSTDGTTNVMDLLKQVGEGMQYINRAIGSGTPYLPVRENLEAEVSIIIPKSTPFRNMLPRTPGSGRASVWKSIVSLGGGWSGIVQPGGGTNIRAFFSEFGAPAEHTTVFAENTAAYKLLGTYGSVSGFGAAIAANFANQLVGEKTRCIQNLQLNEEHALVNADDNDINAPWGDGTQNLAYRGLDKSIDTANGVPTAQVQLAVGTLTFGAIDTLLRVMWDIGITDPWLMMGSQEITSLVYLAMSNKSIIRMTAAATAGDDGGVVLGTRVVGIKHPVSGDIIPLIPSRFVTAGTILVGSNRTPDGKPVMDVQVLPQVMLPQLAPNQNIQGYTAQELAPSRDAPQVFGFIVTLYSTFRLKHPMFTGALRGCTTVDAPF